MRILTEEEKREIAATWDGGKREVESAFSREDLFLAGRPAFERKKQILVSEIVDHIRRILKEKLPDITDAQVEEVLAATVESRSDTLENQYMYHSGQRNQDDTIAENARIMRRYAARVLESLGPEQYTQYTGLRPDEDAWDAINTVRSPENDTPEEGEDDTERDKEASR